jgi:type I restriction enzyme, S subunit
MNKLGIELADGWAIDKLSNLVEILVSNVDKKTVENEPSVSLCNYMDVYTNEYITSKIDFMKATASKSQLSKFIIREGDVMITKDSETPDDIGIASVSLEDFNDVICGYHLALLKPKKDKIFGRFLAKQLGQYQVNRQFANRANGSTRYGLTLNVIETALIPYPASIDKQRKISGILSTCDTVIEQTQAAIAKYKAIKQGMLHDLFTRGLDANGHLRPSYQDAPELYKESELGMIPKEWEVKRLTEITTKIGDGIHTTPNYTESSDYKFINGNNLENGIINITCKTNSVSFEEYRKHKIDLNDKTILMSINGTIGNLAYYRNEKVILGKSAAYICCDNEVDVEYIYFLLSTSILLKYFTDELTGSTIQNLSLASIRNTPILFPKNEEQKMIVKFLRTYNNILISEESHLQKYQSIKKGLMGDLLGGKKVSKLKI